MSESTMRIRSVFAVTHLAVFAAYFGAVSATGWASDLPWLIWMFLDFPVSAILALQGSPGAGSYAPVVVFGLLGTAWWWVVPVIPTRILSWSLAGVHLATLASFVFLLETTTRDGQSALLWLNWAAIDFPFSVGSLLVLLGPWDLGLGTEHVNAFLFLFHGTIGTLWWYYLPRIARRAFVRSRRTG